MKRERLLNEVRKADAELQHDILEELANDTLKATSIDNFRDEKQLKETRKTTYNKVNKGKVKSAKIAGHKFPYLNWGE